MPLDPQDLLKGSIRLSSLPEIYYRINEAISNPGSSFEDIAEIIGQDMSLSVRLLRIVNSSFFNFPVEVETISHAVSIVGTKQLWDLALATSVLTAFKGIPEDQVNMASFWRHSVTCGIAARTFAARLRQNNIERYYLAGILHDIGKLVVFENHSDQAEKILSLSRGKGILFHAAEHAVFGFDHAAIGAALLKTWHLPPSLEEIVACHHDPLKSKRYPLESAVVHLADIMAKAMGMDWSREQYVPPLNAKAWEIIGLSPDQLPSIWDQVEAQLRDTMEMFLSLAGV